MAANLNGRKKEQNGRSAQCFAKKEAPFPPETITDTFCRSDWAMTMTTLVACCATLCSIRGNGKRGGVRDNLSDGTLPLLHTEGDIDREIAPSDTFFDHKIDKDVARIVNSPGTNKEVGDDSPCNASRSVFA